MLKLELCWHRKILVAPLDVMRQFEEASGVFSASYYDLFCFVQYQAH